MEVGSSSPIRYSSDNDLPKAPISPAVPTSQLSEPISYRSSDLGSRSVNRRNEPRSELSIGRLPRIQAAEPGSTDGLSSSMNDVVIWGSDVSISQVQRKLTEFFRTFSKTPGEPLFPAIISEALEAESMDLSVDCTYIYEFDEKLYRQLVQFPQEIIPIMDMVVNKLADEIVASNGMSSQSGMQVRVFNLKEIKNMRDLATNDIDTLVSIRGMVTRSSSLLPDIRKAFFTCSICQNSVEAEIERGRIQEPARCDNCSNQHCMALVHNRCFFSDKQMLKLQETPESIPDGEIPQAVSLHVFDALFDKARPGDRLEVTGIFRAVGQRPNPRQRSIKSIYRTYIDVVHMKKTDKMRMTSEVDAEMNDNPREEFPDQDPLAKVTAEKETLLKEIAASPDVYEKLVRAFAPSIWEMDDVKKGLLCQLFGGTNKEYADGKFRGDINILLAGDPGVSKSQLLQFVHKIAPRGIYTSGKGSSAAGLTAFITRDPETREIILESGALVMSDGGICCIDEFDKMSDTTRAILHEVMEQQTLSIAKAGIVCTLNARASILAAANPKFSIYEPSKTIIENLNLPPTLLSRFDLIYVLRDLPSDAADKKLGRHIVSLYLKNPETERPELDLETFTQYISYARKHIHPRLSDEASEDLVQAYLEMRGLRSKEDPTQITATVRQLDSLIRLSEALARMRFSEIVERVDVAEAVRLVKVSTHKASIDPKTGMVDMDLLTTGMTKAQRESDARLVEGIREFVKAQGIATEKIRTLMEKYCTSTQQQAREDDFMNALRALQTDNFLVIRGPDIIVRS